MTIAPGSRLGQYEIVSLVGAGGMGEVYKAQDTRLKRLVALKFLPPELTRDEPAKQRFLQEAQAASALDHPNICTIHEINETPDGQLYLVMAYYEGETLKEKIDRGPLAIDEALDIAIQIGQGLAEAHAAGVVHRDIKPANVMLTKGAQVKIVDFGLAKLAWQVGLTQTGKTLGTVAYMSPEQARGHEVDHGADLWSLGVVLYEMLAGRRPFPGEHAQSVVYAILNTEVPPLPSARVEVPADLARAVGRALAKPVEERYQTVADLLAELRMIKRTLEGVATGITGATVTEKTVPSIAVLPFSNMSPDPEQEYFCDGLAEELIDTLARLDGLRVVARTSAFQFKGQALDVGEIGKRLKVGTVLEGSVRKAGNRLRINAQLINASDGYHLWSERYDREMDDVFAVQDAIARSVVEKLKVKLLGSQDAPVVKRPTENLEAYNLYLKARYYFVRQTREGLDKSLDCFNQALAMEPTYAPAHAGISVAQNQRAILSFAAPKDVMPRAKEAALKGLALDETVTDAHVALAVVLDCYEWNPAGAEQEYRRALELNPGNTLARSFYSHLLARAGRTDASVAEARQAIERDPLSVLHSYFFAVALVCGRRFEEAIAQAHAGIELEPNYHSSYWSLGWGLAATGRHEEAVGAFRHATTIVPDDPLSRAYLGWAVGLAGHRQEALTILADLEQRRTQEYVAGSLMAAVCLGLGQHEQAISWLLKTFEERDNLLPYLNVWFAYDPLRSDLRFQDLRRRTNFPDQPPPGS